MSGSYDTSLGTPQYNPYQVKLGQTAQQSGLKMPTPQYETPKNMQGQPQMPTTVLGQSGGSNNMMAQMQQLLQQRQMVNGGGVGGNPFSSLFGGGGSVMTPGGMDQTQALATGNQIGPANPTPDQQAAANADVGNESAMASSMPSGAQNSPMTQQAQGMGGGAGAAAGNVAGAALSAIGSYFTQQAQQDANIGKNLVPTIRPQQANFQFQPLIGGGSLV